MATLPLKASHKEQHFDIRFLWAKGLSKFHSLWYASSVMVTAY